MSAPRLPGGPVLAEVVVDDETTAPPQEDGSSRTRRRRIRWAVLAVSGLVAASALAATGAEVVGERARLERLTEVPGVLGRVVDLSGPLTERWRHGTGASWAAPTAGGVVLADDVAGTLEGVDLSGRARWQAAAGEGAGCLPWVPVERFAVGEGALALASTTDAEVALVLCDVPGTGVHAWSATSGELVGLLPYRGEARTIAQVGGDLLLVAPEERGRPEVRRWSPGSDEVLWTAPAPAPRPGLPWLSWDVVAVGDAVVVRGGDSVRLDARTGDLLEPLAADAPRAGVERAYLDGLVRRVTVLADGTEVLQYSARGSDVVRTVVQRPDGTSLTKDGAVLVPLLSDRSTTDLVLVASGASSMSAYDLRTGEETWRANGVRVRAVLMDLEGRLVLAVADGTLVLARATGEELWRGPPAPEIAVSPVTDGDVVLLPELGGDRATNDLVARRLDDGSVLWRTALPAGALELGAVGDVVLVRTAEGLVGLG